MPERHQDPPALDEKVLTGWNGLAIGALASSGSMLGHPDWIAAAESAAADRCRPATSSGPESAMAMAVAFRPLEPTLEDFGMLADGLIDLALATGEARFAVRARELVESTCVARRRVRRSRRCRPGSRRTRAGARERPERGRISERDQRRSREQRFALTSLVSLACRNAASDALAPISPLAVDRPISFGGALGVLSLLDRPTRQLVVVTDSANAELARVARAWRGGLVATVSDEQAADWARAGFELFADRATRNDGTDGIPLRELRLPVASHRGEGTSGAARPGSAGQVHDGQEFIRCPLDE